jgi:phage terminase large subunit-like protein
MAAPSTVITRAKTSDNAANLDASTLQYLNDKYGGTRLGRQELDAELLQDLEGALWSRTLLDVTRIRRADAPDMRRIVVAIDPPGGSARSNAECGIVVAGIGPDRHGYVLADLSGRMSPEKWARTAVNAYHGWRADRIVAEQNFGGAMVESTIKSVDPLVPIKMVVASRGKQIRAEPIAALYEQHRVHHVSEFPSTGGPNDRMGPGGIWSITRSRRRTYVGVHRTDVRPGADENQQGMSGRLRHSGARHLWLVPEAWAVMRVTVRVSICGNPADNRASRRTRTMLSSTPHCRATSRLDHFDHRPR